MRRTALKILSSVLMLSLSVSAAEIGDWTTGATDDGQLYALVINDSGSALMKGCMPSAGVCYWYLAIPTSCQGKQQGPALVSSSAGAATTSLVCDGPTKTGKTLFRYRIGTPDMLDDAIKSSKPLGIAIALDDGRFGVYRFSMVGAERAISILMQGAIRMNGNGSGQSGTRDSTL